MDESDQQARRLDLPERLDYAAAESLRDMLEGLDADTVLDASEVCVMTAPAVQVLLAVQTDLRSRGAELRIERSTRDLEQCAALLGASGLLSPNAMEGGEAR